MPGAADAMQPPPPRTLDVLSSTKSFAGLLLPPAIEQALREAGFRRPSPVQEAALPLARMGTDLVVQAKAGTGKTLVFAVAAVERVDLSNGAPQVLVLAPTREIALQGSEAVALAAAALPPPGLACGSFIGGFPVEEDEKQLRRACHVGVGTTGRVLSLIQRGALRTDSVRLVVLDEADKLLADSFRKDTLAILAGVPQRHQLLALSATFAPAALDHLRRLMDGQQQEVLLCAEDTSLLGVRQCYKMLGTSSGRGAGASTVRAEQQQQRRQEQQQQDKQQQQQQQQDQHPSSSTGWLEARVAALLQLLSTVSFQQAVVFCKYRADAEAVSQRLVAAGYPAAFLTAQRTQLQRIEAINALRDFRLRVAVTTDLAARGVDLERVNLVINLVLPQDAATYMHRVGRAGRFGTRGVAVTLLEGGAELRQLEAYLAEVAGGQVTELPDFVPEEWYHQQQYRTGAAACGIAIGPATPSSTANLLAASGDSWGSDGQGLLADIATASLWLDEQPEVEAPDGQQQQHGAIDLSYTFVPRPAATVAAAAAAAASLAAAPSSAAEPAAGAVAQKPAVSSLTTAVAAAEAAAAVAAAHGSRGGSASRSCSSADSADSWDSTSDDDYTGSSGSDAEYAAAMAAAVTACGSVGGGSDGATPLPVSFKPLRRVGSASSAGSGCSSSSGSAGRISSLPAPIPGRLHLLQQDSLHRQWTNSYEDARTGLAAALLEAPAGASAEADTEGDTSNSPRSAAAGGTNGMISSEEEPSFKDSWLNEEQQQSAAAEKARRRQQRRTEAAAAAAASGFELRPHGRSTRSGGASARRGAGRAAAGSTRRSEQVLQPGHYWQVVRTVQQDVQGRLVSDGSRVATEVTGQEEDGQEGGSFVPVVSRQQQPLGSAQASATRRQEEEVAAARAAAEAETAALKQMAEQQDAEAAAAADAGLAAVAADATAAAEQQQRQWSEFWMSHYAYYGCYPSEGLFSTSSTAAGAAHSSPQAVAPTAAPTEAASLLPPPPAPPSPPPQLSAATWACQPPPYAEVSGSSSGAAAAAATMAAAAPRDAGGGEGAWVQVPSLLLARYQQLEWEQWHRQYTEWQTLWEQYKQYWAELYQHQQQCTAPHIE